MNTIRIENLSDLATVTVSPDVDSITVSYPAAYIEGDANIGYDPDAEALIEAIFAHFSDFVFTGSTGIEENGKGEWLKMVRKSSI